MTDPTLPTDLAGATGPDRTLDVRIAVAVGAGLPMVNGRTLAEALVTFPHDGVGIARSFCVERYTASIDAALTLVPADRMWFVGHLDSTALCFAATITRVVGGYTWRGIAETAPLALCLAALRSRADQVRAPKKGE